MVYIEAAPAFYVTLAPRLPMPFTDGKAKEVESVGARQSPLGLSRHAHSASFWLGRDFGQIGMPFRRFGAHRPSVRMDQLSKEGMKPVVRLVCSSRHG